MGSAIHRVMIGYWVGNGQIPFEGQDHRHVDGTRETGVVQWVQDIPKQVVVNIHGSVLLSNTIQYTEYQVHVIEYGQEDQQPIKDTLHGFGAQYPNRN